MWAKLTLDNAPGWNYGKQAHRELDRRMTGRQAGFLVFLA